jgi:amino acid adenylation domain-containing protein
MFQLKRSPRPADKHAGTTVSLRMPAGTANSVRQVRPTNPYMEFCRSEIEQSIAARFEKQVVQHRHRLALRTCGYELTYNELNNLANRIAHSIRQSSVREIGAVALLLDHDAPLIAAILGILKAGRFYVALDPSQPSPRLADIVQDSEADILIVDSKHFARAREIAPENYAIINYDQLDAELGDENLALTISPSALAYLVYTSGSTGRPKGVCQTQRNVLHHTRKYTTACHLCANDRFSLLASCSFSASVSNLFGSLLNGAALFPFDVKTEGIENLRAWLHKEEISIYHSVPLLFRKLCASISDDSDFPKLRLIKLGGDAITRGEFDLYKHYFADHSLLYVGLDSSEMNCIRHWLLDHQSTFDGSIAPVGYAVEDTEVLLVDQNQTEVSPGETGEIAIRSSYLFPGYWRRPDLTNAAFTSDPGGNNKRIFRTGDLGRLLPNGLLLHLGRRERALKVRGVLVDPAEIEHALRSQPEVTDCAVLAKTAKISGSSHTSRVQAVRNCLPLPCARVWQKRCQNTWCRRDITGWISCL